LVNNNWIKTIPFDGLAPNQIHKKVEPTLYLLFSFYLVKWLEGRSKEAPSQMDQMDGFFNC
jgi:hypothetical protein